MIMNGKIAGSRMIFIILQNIESEPAEEVIDEILNVIVPAIIAKYLPEESYEKTNSLLFAVTMRMLESGKFLAV